MFIIIKVLSKFVLMDYYNMWFVILWVFIDKMLISYRGRIGVVENFCEGSF